MTAPWLTYPSRESERRAAVIAAAIPRIETERLILRAPRLSDWPTLAPIWTSDQGRYITDNRDEENGWLDLNQLTAGWILRGFGGLVVERKSSGDVLGVILLEHEFGDPEPELGWLLTKEAEGHGYALEAARAMLATAHDIFKSGTFVSYIHKDNAKSRRLAENLGATLDPAPHPLGADVLVYRHQLPESPS